MRQGGDVQAPSPIARAIYLEYRKADEFDMPGIVNEQTLSSEAARFKDSQQKP
jgi:hypothetical protein